MDRLKRYNAWIERHEKALHCVFLPINTVGVLVGTYAGYDKLVACAGLYAGYSCFVLIKHWRRDRERAKRSFKA